MPISKTALILIIILPFTAFAQKDKFYSTNKAFEKDNHVIATHSVDFVDSATVILNVRVNRGLYVTSELHLRVATDEGYLYTRIHEKWQELIGVKYLKIGSDIYRIRCESMKSKMEFFADRFADTVIVKNEKPFFSGLTADGYAGRPKISIDDEFIRITTQDAKKSSFFLSSSTFKRENFSTVETYAALVKQVSDASVDFFTLNDRTLAVLKYKQGNKPFMQVYGVTERGLQESKLEMNIRSEHQSLGLVASSQENVCFFNLWSHIPNSEVNQQVLKLDLSTFKLEKTAEKLITSEQVFEDYPEGRHKLREGEYIHVGSVTEQNSTYVAFMKYDEKWVSDGQGGSILFTFFSDLLVTKITDGHIEWTRCLRHGAKITGRETTIFTPKMILGEDELLLGGSDYSFFFDSEGKYIPKKEYGLHGENKITGREPLVPNVVLLEKTSGEISSRTNYIPDTFSVPR